MVDDLEEDMRIQRVPIFLAMSWLASEFGGLGDAQEGAHMLFVT